MLFRIIMAFVCAGVIRRGILLLQMAAAVTLLPACSSNRSERRESTRIAMGVQTRIVVYAPPGDSAQAAMDGAFGVIARLEQSMSDYRPTSEVRRLVQQPPGAWVDVSPDLWRVLRTAESVSRASDGAFDVTVGPLVELWRSSRESGSLPDEKLLAAARSRVGWAFLESQPASHQVRLGRADMAIDLGGIGKGYAAAEAVRHLVSLGYRRCMVALAGDIAVGDPPPGQAGWRIDVSHFDSAPVATLVLTNACVSTAGDREQFIEIGGVRYSHIVDPRTGLGTTSQVAATVVSPDGALADGLDSALCLMEPGDWVRAVERFAGAAAIVSRPDHSPVLIDPSGRLRLNGGDPLPHQSADSR